MYVVSTAFRLFTITNLSRENFAIPPQRICRFIVFLCWISMISAQPNCVEHDPCNPVLTSVFVYIRQFCPWAWFSSELVQLKEIHTLRMQVARHKNHARKYNFLFSQLRRGGQKKHWTASFISVYNWPSKFSSLKKSLGGLNTVATLRYKIAEDLEGLKVWQSWVFPVHFTIFPTCKKGWAIVLFHNRVVVKTCRGFFAQRIPLMFRNPVGL